MAAASLNGFRYGSSAALAAQASPAMSSVVLTPVSAASPPPARMNSGWTVLALIPGSPYACHVGVGDDLHPVGREHRVEHSRAGQQGRVRQHDDRECG